MTRRREFIYAFAAVVSGAVWFALAALCDSTRGEYIGGTMPFIAPGAQVLFPLAGIGAGVAVSYGCRNAFRKARLPWELLLPLVTIPFGVSVFAMLVWVARRALSIPSWGLSPSEELATLLTGYLVYAMLSLLMPVAYALALVNQGIMSHILRGGVEQRVEPDEGRKVARA